MSLGELGSFPATDNSVASYDAEDGDVTVAFHYHDGDTRLRVLSLVEGGERVDPVLGPHSPFEIDHDIGRARFPAWGPVRSDDGDDAWSEGELFFHYHREDGRGDDIYAVEGDSIRPVVVQRGSCRITDVIEEGLLFTCASVDGSELYRYEGATEETTRLAAPDEHVLGAKASPDGEFVAYARSPATAYSKGESDVYLTAIDSSGIRRELETGRDGAGIRDWTTVEGADRLLISDSTVDEKGVGVVDLPGGWRDGDGALRGDLAWIGSDDHEERALQFDGPDRVLGERVTHGAELIPVVYDSVDGDPSITPVDDAEGFTDFAGEGYGASLGDDRYLVEHRTPTAKTRLYEYDHASGEYTRLFDLDEAGASDLVEPTHESFAVSTDGAEPAYVDRDSARGEGADLPRVGGLFYDPDTDEPSPAVLWVSRTPDRRSGQNFDAGAQYLAGRGLSVFRVNQRGASGYLGGGQPDLRGGFGRDDQADIAAAADWLADREGVDADRVAVFGRRYGGYSVFVQLRDYPDRYAGGVAWDGISDLAAFGEDDDASDRIKHRIGDLLGGDDTEAVRTARSPRPGWEDTEAPLAILCTPGNRGIPADQSRKLHEGLVDGDGHVEYADLPDGKNSAAYDYLLRFVDRQP